MKSRLGRIVGSLVAMVGAFALAGCNSNGCCPQTCAPKCAPKCPQNPGKAVYQRPCCAGYMAPRGCGGCGAPGAPMMAPMAPQGGSMGPATPATSYGSPTPQPGASQMPGHGQMACGAGKCG
jgi:hypothetical protein